MNIISYKDAFVEPAYFDPIEETIEGWIRHETGPTAIKLMHKEGYIPGLLVRPEIKPFTRDQTRSYLLKKLQHLKIEAIKGRQELAKLPTETKKRKEVPKVEPNITPELSDVVRRMREQEAESDTRRLKYLQHIGHSDVKPASVDDEIANIMTELRMTQEPSMELPVPTPYLADVLIKVRPWRLRGLMNQKQFLGRRYTLQLDNGERYTVIGQHLEVDPHGMHPTGVQFIVWDPRREPARRYNQLPAKSRSYLTLEEQEEEGKRQVARKQQEESDKQESDKKAAEAAKDDKKAPAKDDKKKK
jgi:hypothetical protein